MEGDRSIGVEVVTPDFSLALMIEGPSDPSGLTGITMR